MRRVLRIWDNYALASPDSSVVERGSSVNRTVMPGRKSSGWDAVSASSVPQQ